MRDSVMVGLRNNDSIMRRERRSERRTKANSMRKRKPIRCGVWEARNVSMKDRVNTWSSVAEWLMAASPKAGDPDRNYSRGVEETEAGFTGSGQNREARTGMLTIFQGHS